ncbi:unnamed protein product [Callosobruchus maculatus]|uniref:EGF-like domain-containing protein n=1 Tax=Callosobruchus maculatus TaxID=64391 RepID=A0A653BDN5_CALMS|nr:unnamed protein product [Callosobruchus maculatus]
MTKQQHKSKSGAADPFRLATGTLCHRDTWYAVSLLFNLRNWHLYLYCQHLRSQRTVFYRWGTSCIAECLDNSDCAGHKTCSAGNCIDPCVGVCGANANCETRNHVPVCSCPAGFTGDPFTGCRRFDPGAVSSKSLWDQHEL